MCQKVTNQKIVIRSDRPDKYSPTNPENEMPLPLRIVQSKS